MTTKQIIAALAAATAISTQAEDLKTEITVDRTIVPIEREAFRLGSLTPQLLSSPVSMKQLSLADYTESSAITRSASTLEPASYADSFTLSPYRGYASLGYFPTFNLGASAGYKFLDTDRTRLGAWVQYDGYSYKPSGNYTDGGKYSNNTVTVGASLDQRVGSKSALGAHLSYMHSALGLPHIFIGDSQNANAFDADLSWWSKAGMVGYHAKASFSHFAYGKALIGTDSEPEIKPAGENRFNFNAGIAFFGSSVVPRGGLEVAADFIHRNNANDVIKDNMFPGGEIFFTIPSSTSTLGIVSLTPYYTLHSGKVNVKLGAKIDISVGGEGKKFHIAPAVMLDWNAASQFAVYARFGGGEYQNSLRSLYDYCPFMPGYFSYQRSHVPVTADLGINVGPFAGFSARLFGGYAVANDWLMPVIGETYFAHNNAGGVMSHYGANDLKGWHAGIGLSYEWRSVVKANVSAETASNDLDKAYYLWRDRAKYVLNASLEVRPIEPLKIGVTYQLRTDRHNYLFEATGKYHLLDINSISDLSVNASYVLTPAFTIFARGENLLNHRYQLVSAFEAQGLKGLVGVAYKF